MGKDVNKIIHKERGSRLRAVRMLQGLTQDNMACKMDINTTSHYQNLEYGNNPIQISHLEKLREEFGISSHYILFGDIKNEKDWMCDFYSLPPDQKMTIFIEICKHVVCEPQCDFEVYIKKNDD